MRRIAVVAVVVLAGCGLRYTGTEQQMQQVARGTAELLKKDPYSDTVTSAGTGAHLALSTLIPAESKSDDLACMPGVLAGCVRPWQAGAVTGQRQQPATDFTGLPNDFYKTTSIGKD
ncbi:hypothetical protein [Cupriavidus sp. H39]|uniref:hypothetical protein n=1 Tax=Cupriavidus sp. H39 TaxID=3401635 RepID=UPI003D01E315